MAREAELSLEEGIGLGLAATLHVALAAALILQRDPPAPIVKEERITVTLSEAEDVALDSAAPNPAPAAAAAEAPTMSDIPEPNIAPPPPPEPVPVPRPTASPPPRPTATPTRRPTPTPTASRRPTPTPTASRRPTPTPSASRRPTPAPSASASRRPTPAPSASASRRPTPTPTATRSGGASRMGDDFLPGTGTATTPNAGTPAATFGATERASLQSAITRQLRPHWSAPQGVDIDLLVTVVRFRLNQDGRLAGTPSCIRQSGESASNRPQMGVHCERAIRAITLAAPFNLPQQFYSHWDQLEWTFDRRL